MGESELARQIKRAVDSGDKLVRDIRDDTADVLIALRDLRNLFLGKEDGKNEEGPETK